MKKLAMIMVASAILASCTGTSTKTTGSDSTSTKHDTSMVSPIDSSKGDSSTKATHTASVTGTSTVTSSARSTSNVTHNN